MIIEGMACAKELLRAKCNMKLGRCEEYKKREIDIQLGILL